MSKQRRGSRGRTTEGTKRAETELDGVDRQVVRGPERTPAFDSDSGLVRARDVALPILEHAQLALEVDVGAGARLARNLEIVEGSHLPRDQRAQLSDRLIERATVSDEIARAFADSFGQDDAASRDDVSLKIENLYEALSGGNEDNGSLALADGRRVSVPEGRPAAPELIRQTASLLEGPQAGTAILAFCQRARLALMLEEEEDWVASPSAAEQLE